MFETANVLQQLAVNSFTNALALITACVTKCMLTLDFIGAMGCSGSIISSVLAAVTALLTTIVSVLGQAINLVLSLISCAISAVATAVAIAGSALTDGVTCVSKLALINLILPPVSYQLKFNSLLKKKENIIFRAL